MSRACTRKTRGLDYSTAPNYGLDADIQGLLDTSYCPQPSKNKTFLLPRALAHVDGEQRMVRENEEGLAIRSADDKL
jgi:hypothetical protein